MQTDTNQPGLTAYAPPLLWVLMLFGILSAEPIVASVVGTDHAICGVWGCGPPISALIVWHGFLAAAGIPGAVLLAKTYPQAAERSGTRVLGLTILVIALFIVGNTAMWFEAAGTGARQFVLRRLLFATVAFTDAPVLPVLLTAGTWWWMSRRGSASNSHGRTNVQQLEHFTDVPVGKVDAAS